MLSERLQQHQLVVTQQLPVHHRGGTGSCSHMGERGRGKAVK